MSLISRQKAYNAHMASRRFAGKSCIAHKNELPAARRRNAITSSLLSGAAMAASGLARSEIGA
jgi:hypothetical protein